MTTDRVAPQISLGAGSYDYDVLRLATDAAVQGSGDDAEKASAALKTAVETSNVHPAIGSDPRDVPGYAWAEVEGSTGQIETIQVPVAAAADPETAAEPETLAGKPGNKPGGTGKTPPPPSTVVKPTDTGAIDAVVNGTETTV